MHVHILGLVSLNGGDAAILVAQREVLDRQWPGVRVTVSDTHPDAATRYLPDFTFVPFLMPALLRAGGRRAQLASRLRLARVKAAATLHGRGAGSLARLLVPAPVRSAWREVAGADVLAYTGGTTLTENYTLTEKVFDLEVARRLRKPLVFLPQSAGPFSSPENLAGLRPVLAAADLVLLRDARSLEHVVEAGAVRARCEVVPDIVFALARPDEALRVAPPATPGGPRLAVSVREWAHFRDATPEAGMRRYTDALRAAVTAAVRRAGASVTFVSTCQGRPEYVRDDSVFARSVVEGLPADVRAAVDVDSSAHAPTDLVDVLSAFDAMLSTRLHGAISAVCTGVPTLTIAYEYKTTEVWKQLDLAEWTVDIDDVDADLLAGKVLNLLDRAPQVRKALATSVPPMRDRALAVGADVAAVLGGVR